MCAALPANKDAPRVTGEPGMFGRGFSDGGAMTCLGEAADVKDAAAGIGESMGVSALYRDAISVAGNRDATRCAEQLSFLPTLHGVGSRPALMHRLDFVTGRATQFPGRSGTADAKFQCQGDTRSVLRALATNSADSDLLRYRQGNGNRAGTAARYRRYASPW